MQKIRKILHILPEKKAKFSILGPNLGYYGQTRIFWKIWVCSVIDPYENLASCRKSGKSYVSFLKNGKSFDFGPKFGPIWAISVEQEFFEKFGFAGSLTLMKTYLHAKNQENPTYRSWENHSYGRTDGRTYGRRQFHRSLSLTRVTKNTHYNPELTDLFTSPIRLKISEHLYFNTEWLTNSM